MALHTYSEDNASGCEKDCREIHATWDRLSHLAQALAHRTLSARRQIRETYQAIYREDLVERLHRTHMANLRNDMFKMLYMWMMELHQRDALVAHEALEYCCETDYRALMEIYARRKSSHLFLTKQAYLSRFSRHLDQEIISLPAHPYQKILVALATSHRSHHTETSNHIAKCDAKRLYEAGKGSTGSVDEAVILEMFSKRSIPQLRLAFSSYKHIYGRDYTKALKKESCGEFEDCLRIVVKCMYDPFKYYAKMLYASLKGPKTNVLSRVMMGSAEVGMDEVKAAFQKRYQLRLEDAIYQGLPPGDYRDFLAALTNAPASTR